MIRHGKCLAWLWSVVLVAGSFVLPLIAAGDTVVVLLRNDSGARLQVGWINPNDKTAIHKMGILEPFGTFRLKTFPDHQFELLEVPSENTGKCTIKSAIGSRSKPLETYNGCALNKFRASSDSEQKLLVTEFLQIRKDDAMEEASKIVEPSESMGKCRFEAKRKLIKAREAGHSKDALDRIVDQFRDCLVHGTVPNLMNMDKELLFEERVRKTISGKLENFTCTEDLAESTPDVDLREWTSEKDLITRRVHIKLDRPATQIHVVENFASIEECNAMEERVADKLGFATTEDGEGGAHVSRNRKAMQSYFEPDWSKEDEGDPILKLNRRIFDYANHVLGLNITVYGQEPLMSIQYFGRGSSDLEPDRYTPHCDGTCEGRPFIHASRMATMVIYCTIPERGGHTNFQNAGVAIKPEVGSGIFFSYINPSTNITDNEFSRHSGCPVYDGQKKIITQWIRLGVNADITYEAYNTLEVLRSEDGE